MPLALGVEPMALKVISPVLAPERLVVPVIVKMPLPVAMVLPLKVAAFISPQILTLGAREIVVPLTFT